MAFSTLCIWVYSLRLCHNWRVSHRALLAEPVLHPKYLLLLRCGASYLSSPRVRCLQILRKQMELCYKREGVNQLVACREIVDRYWESIKDVDFQLADSTRYASGHQDKVKR